MQTDLYPYYSPIILTDVIFTLYGGSTDNTTGPQRQAAFLLAEMDVTEALGTFLLPTTVTGSYVWDQQIFVGSAPYFHYGPRSIILGHSWVNSVPLIQFVDREERVFDTVSGTANIYASLRNPDRGILDVDKFTTNCRCLTSWNTAYKVNVVYEAGFSSGTSYQPNMLMALTIYADIILNEIIGYGNEAPGDVGIAEYSNQMYRERRKGLRNTVLGQSPKANLADRLLNKYKKRQWVGM